MIERDVIHVEDNFDYPLAPTAGTPQKGWVVKDTSSAGTPTYTSVSSDGGGFKLLLANTDEAEIVTLYHGDYLFYRLDQLINMEWNIQADDMDALTVLVFGFGTAQADDEDTITVSAWGKVEGATSTTALVVESDDGTTDKNDVATATTMTDGQSMRFLIDLSYGLADVRFYFNGSRVASGTTFSLANITSGQRVQPFVQLSKPSGTGTPSCTVSRFASTRRWVKGAAA